MQPLLNPKSFTEELRGGDGSKFELFMNDLIEREADREGISTNDIVFDYRTNVGDQGIDLAVNAAPTTAKPRFIPKACTIWSFKSGDDGVNPSKFKSEITKGKHKPLRDRLNQGYTLVWCTIRPATRKQREKVEAKVATLVKKYGWKHEQFAFRWANNIRSAANRHLNLLKEHLPKAWSIVKKLKSISRWHPKGLDKGGYGTRLVDIPGRAKLAATIQAHLRAENGPAAMHIAGLSGIGKTRLVKEACVTAKDLRDTFYLERGEYFTEELFEYLSERGKRTRLIIDEVPPSEFNELHGQLDKRGKQLRVVTIGPARKDEKTAASSAITILSEPNDGDAVFDVVKSRSPNLPDNIARIIAALAGHDLRLAILLTDATGTVDPNAYVSPILDKGEILNRVLALFQHEAHIEKLKENYRYLTVAIDVGTTGKPGDELEFLAQTFSVDIKDLRDCIDVAAKIGLGIPAINYFEAFPRGLAVHVFTQAFHQVRPLLRKLLDECQSQRLVKRVIERCQELEGKEREEAAEIIGDSFRSKLGKPNILTLVDRPVSRVFARWVELDPDQGLQWLSEAIQSATHDELAKFDATPDGSGGWRGRRQIVWLLEHLACFAEHFWKCEECLFRLAQVETEEAVANNSLHTWEAMFAPALSNTEVPFPERWPHLIKRLQSATSENIDIILDAAKKAFSRPFMRMAPPAVVGGKIVPRQWQPKTSQELAELQRKAAAEFLGAFNTLPEDIRQRAAVFLIENFGTLLSRATVHALKATTQAIVTSDDLQRHLYNALKDTQRLEQVRKDPAIGADKLQQLTSWIEETTPTDLKGRTSALTAEPYWSTGKIVGTKHPSDLDIPYANIAKELLNDLATLNALKDWLNDKNCVSGEQLGAQLGALDQAQAAAPTMLAWLREKAALPTVVGYFRIAKLLANTQAELSNTLDAISNDDPSQALLITAHVDVSLKGFERCVALLPKLPSSQLGTLQLLAYESWRSKLTLDQKVRLADLVIARAKDDAAFLRLAFHLLYFWAAPGRPEQDARLNKQVLDAMNADKALQTSVDEYQWSELARFIMKGNAARCADIFVDHLTRFESRGHRRAEQALELLKDLAPTHPKEVLASLLSAIRDKKRLVTFYVFEFRELFEAIPLEILKPALIEEGVVAGRAIARHLASPSLDAQGKPFVPPLTDWLLTEFSHDPRVLKEFLIGRHSGEVHSGHARDRAPAQRKILDAFREFKQHWIQEWIKYEEQEIKGDIAFDDKMDERLERE